ncbi:cytochrome c4 [Candidatus Ruthia endofausta]|uniref:Cytochrome c4 n=1 Tax=Candidatus Ruthia endofausta TaxID=2738852 RepID=A0A6N0HPN8_9GAMM|nr:c-type cytochrome [Candidatus Ruthia endofausta]QKQ24265.1 cytochrome c4 [Candidatus Ruthia endofausta]
MNKLASIFIIAIAFTSINVFASGDVVKGKVTAVTCVACHGVQGNSVVATFPKLAGQGEGYLLKQLQDFKSNVRQDAIMKGTVAPLTESDMENLAAYFSKQTITQGVASKNANIALGERLYRGGNKEKGVTACIACHGPIGTGIPSAKFPALVSQHAAYITKQLIAFRQDAHNVQMDTNAAERNNDYEGMMRNITKYLSNKEIEAVSQYIAGLQN